MNSSRLMRLVLIVILCTLLSPLAYAQSTNQTYVFKVFLEDEEIGQQRFVVTPNGTGTKVEIEAQFDVKFWILTAYSYRHVNTEVWNGECLSMIRSQTNDNGETYFVHGTSSDKQLELVSHAGTRTIQGCVKTFAYWNRNVFFSPSLLNSQTGEMNQIELRNLGEDLISVRNQPTPAIHYQIDAEKFSVDLWYSASGEWLALQSTTEDDSKLRYELQ